MTTRLVVDLAAPTPVYEQIRAQIAAAVRTGELRPGDRLPTVRSVAADLGIAVNTVARAYSELESAGYVTTRRRVGTVVAPSAGPAVPEELIARARDYAAAVAAAGCDEQVGIDLLRSAWRRHQDQSDDASTPNPISPSDKGMPIY